MSMRRYISASIRSGCLVSNAEYLAAPRLHCPPLVALDLYGDRCVRCRSTGERVQLSTRSRHRIQLEQVHLRPRQGEQARRRGRVEGLPLADRDLPRLIPHVVARDAAFEGHRRSRRQAGWRWLSLRLFQDRSTFSEIGIPVALRMGRERLGQDARAISARTGRQVEADRDRTRTARPRPRRPRAAGSGSPPRGGCCRGARCSPPGCSAHA